MLWVSPHVGHLTVVLRYWIRGVIFRQEPVLYSFIKEQNERHYAKFSSSDSESNSYSSQFHRYCSPSGFRIPMEFVGLARRFIARFPKQKISRASRNPEAVTLDHPAPPPLHCIAYRLRPLLRFWDVDTA